MLLESITLALLGCTTILADQSLTTTPITSNTEVYNNVVSNMSAAIVQLTQTIRSTLGTVKTNLTLPQYGLNSPEDFKALFKTVEKLEQSVSMSNRNISHSQTSETRELYGTSGKTTSIPSAFNEILQKPLEEYHKQSSQNAQKITATISAPFSQFSLKRQVPYLGPIRIPRPVSRSSDELQSIEEKPEKSAFRTFRSKLTQPLAKIRAAKFPKIGSFGVRNAASMVKSSETIAKTKSDAKSNRLVFVSEPQEASSSRYKSSPSLKTSSRVSADRLSSAHQSKLSFSSLEMSRDRQRSSGKSSADSSAESLMEFRQVMRSRLPLSVNRQSEGNLAKITCPAGMRYCTLTKRNKNVVSDGEEGEVKEQHVSGSMSGPERRRLSSSLESSAFEKSIDLKSASRFDIASRSKQMMKLEWGSCPETKNLKDEIMKRELTSANLRAYVEKHRNIFNQKTLAEFLSILPVGTMEVIRSFRIGDQTAQKFTDFLWKVELLEPCSSQVDDSTILHKNPWKY